jgi:DNA recombination protein RmuC
MIFLLIFLAGAIVGGIFAGILISSKSRSKCASAEATTAEIRRQLEEKTTELEKLRHSLQEEQQARITAITRLDEATKSVEDQRKILAEAQQRLADTFKALSDDALKSNNQAFIQLAKQSLETVLSDAKGDIGKRQEAIGNLVKPLEEVLKRYESQVGKMEQDRSKAYGSLEEQLRTLALTQQQLQKETGNLVSALRKPQVRGRWGELTLRRVVELAGLTEHCDYTEQFTVQGEEGKIRPDLVIHLPSGRQVVVDCKVSLDAYLDAVAAQNEEIRETALLRHAQQLRKHMTHLSSKAYWSELSCTPEFVVMFIPGESFVSAAVESDSSLIEDGIIAKVIIATPTTIIALLRAIAYGWRQEQIAKNAQMIAEHGRQVYERFAAFLEHVKKMRKSLEDAVFAYNRMIGSVEGRILPSVRKFKELGATGAEEIAMLEPIEQSPRQLEAVEPLEQ